MERKKRIGYLAVTLTMFVSVTLMFYFAGDFSSTFPVENETRFRLVGSLMMGYVLTGLLSGMMLASGFFARRSLLFKLAAAALWFVTLFVVFAAGEFLLIPYQIYNLIRIIGDRPEKGKEAPEAEETEEANDAL